MKLDPIGQSVLRSNINTLIGLALVASCALWAATVITRAAWGINPIASAFAAAIDRETTLPY